MRIVKRTIPVKDAETTTPRMMLGQTPMLVDTKTQDTKEDI